MRRRAPGGLVGIRFGAACAALLALACATSPLGRRQLLIVSDAEMDKMGVAAFDQLKQQAKLSDDPRANAFVVCVARAITDALPPEWRRDDWEVRVFRDDTANAFALPGGKIGVNTGLLAIAENQDQLATVIGHELAHVIARHSSERMSAELLEQIALSGAAAAIDPSSPARGAVLQGLGLGAQVGVLLPYSRAHESEADLLGLDLMSRAGFDPRQSIALWHNMEKAAGKAPPVWLSTHPATPTRIHDLEQRVPRDLKLRDEARRAGRDPHCAR
jgi:predicted Zn-dependent protease